MKAPDSGLTFHWPDSRAVSFVLPGFLALSLLGHAVSFYIFQITYPPSGHIAPPPAQVSLLGPGTPANDALLRWIESEDPSLITKTPEVTPAHILDVPYEPSFTEVRTQPRLPAEPTASHSFPAAISPLMMIDRAIPQPVETKTPTAPRATQIRYSQQFAQRSVTRTVPVHFHTDLNELHPARFLIGVSERGEIRYIFLQNSSGDKAIDDQAELQLRQTEFAPGNESLVWGLAIFSWGADVFAKSTPST